MDNLILELFHKDCIKIGKFNLKNGTVSPIYIDLKNIISYPSLLNTIVKTLELLLLILISIAYPSDTEGKWPREPE